MYRVVLRKGLAQTGLRSVRNFSTGPSSIVSKYNLNHPTRWIPLSAGGLLLANVTGLYHLDSETQMLGLFALFVATIYSKAGPMIASTFDTQADNILAEQRAVEDKQITAVANTLKVHKNAVDLAELVKQVEKGQMDLSGNIVGSLGEKLKEAVDKDMERKMSTILQLERDTGDEVMKALVENGAKYVTEAFESDAALRARSLDAAIESLDSGEMLGENEVGKKFEQFIRSFREENESGKELELSDQDLQFVKEEVEKIAKREGITGVDIDSVVKKTIKL